MLFEGYATTSQPLTDQASLELADPGAQAIPCVQLNVMFGYGILKLRLYDAQSA